MTLRLLSFLILCTGLIWLPPHFVPPPETVGLDTVKKRNAWFKQRYKPNMPLYISAYNAPEVLAQISRERELKAVKSMLQRQAPLKHQRKGHISCAVVGNSGNLLGSGYGKLIDSHTYVFRMNNAPIEGYEQDVGKRTTYHVLHSGQAIRAYDKNTSTVLVTANIGFNPHEGFNWSSYKKRIADKLRLYSRTKLAKEKPVRFYILHPLFLGYIDRHWFTPSQRRFKYEAPSTGFKTLILSFHLCDEVDVFGFGANATGAWDHYYDKDVATMNVPGDKTLGRHRRIPPHRKSYQAKLLEAFEQKKFITVYPGNAERKPVDRTGIVEPAEPPKLLLEEDNEEKENDTQLPEKDNKEPDVKPMKVNKQTAREKTPAVKK